MEYRRTFFKKYFVLLFLVLLLPSTAMSAGFSGKVFEFQKRVASKGDSGAQYKLGTMYEMGLATKKDLNEALRWYKKAASQKHKAAIRRVTYIDVLKNGFNKSKHGSWLQGVKKNADNKDGEAIFLLGLMYKNGTVVKQNLALASKYFKRAATKNIAGAEEELDAVKIVLAEKREQRQLAKQKRLAEEKRIQEEKNRQQQALLRKKKLEQQRREKKRLAQTQLKIKKIEVVKKPEPVKKKLVVTHEKKQLSWAEAMALKEKQDN